MPDGAVLGRVVGERFFSRLPAHISDGLSPQQRDAIAAALCAEWEDQPPVNIRLSIPMLVGRWYFTLFAGRERRDRRRLRAGCAPTVRPIRCARPAISCSSSPARLPFTPPSRSVCCFIRRCSTSETGRFRQIGKCFSLSTKGGGGRPCAPGN